MKKSRSNDRSERSAASGGSGSPSSAVPTTPQVGSYTAPAAFFVALGVLAYLGHAELAYHHGSFSAGIYEPYDNFSSIPKLGGPSRYDQGKDVYAAAGCVACHQPNGSGNPANGCPPLAKSDWVTAEGPSRLIRMVLHGGQGPIVVSGKPWAGGVMTPFGPILSDDQIANVLTYIRQNSEWGNTASEVTPEMVKAIRDKTASRTTPWTADELLKIPVSE